MGCSALMPGDYPGPGPRRKAQRFQSWPCGRAYRFAGPRRSPPGTARQARIGLTVRPGRRLDIPHGRIPLALDNARPQA